jgi:hypothetical protein
LSVILGVVTAVPLVAVPDASNVPPVPLAVLSVHDNSFVAVLWVSEAVNVTVYWSVAYITLP